MGDRLKAPFPYFGGKSRVAGLVWARFGVVRNYVEPFFGSGAVLLGRPQPFRGTETVNDKCGFIANFWRALQADPDTVAEAADRPVNENDMHAIHAWLVGQKESLQARLEGDPEWYDAKVAGRWVFGICCWIGSGWCSGQGPWRRVEVEPGRWELRPDAEPEKGAWRQRVHLGDAGRGVNRQRVHLGDAGRGVNRQRVALRDYLRELADRLRDVRVCCGDWTRVCGGKSGNAIRCLFASGGTCAVFLDPPYADTAGRDGDLYRVDSLSVAHEVREWAIAHGDDRRLRIALCGYEGEHVMPDTWECVAWKAKGGYGSQSKSRGRANAHRERIWFSKSCLKSGETFSSVA